METPSHHTDGASYSAPTLVYKQSESARYFQLSSSAEYQRRPRHLAPQKDRPEDRLYPFEATSCID